MSDLTRADLDTATKNMRAHIDGKFDDLYRYTKEVNDTTKKRLDTHDTTLYGNGSDGLKDRVTKVEADTRTGRKVILWVAGLLSTALGWVGIKTVPWN